MGFRKRWKYPITIIIGLVFGSLTATCSTGYIFLTINSQLLKNITNTGLEFIDLAFAGFFLIGVLVTKRTFNTDLGAQANTFFAAFFTALSLSTHVFIPYLLSH